MIRRHGRALRLFPALFDGLESRVMLSGVIAVGPATGLFPVTGQFTSVAAAAVGSSGNTLVTWLDNTNGGSSVVTLREAIIGANLSVVSGPTLVDVGGLKLDPFGKVASVTDSNGNVAVLFPVASSSFTPIWYVGRFAPAGNLLGSPTLIGDSNLISSTEPGIAAGPGGEVGVVFGGAAAQNGPAAVFGEVFDANDNPLTAKVQLSGAPPATGQDNLLSTLAAFDPSSGNFFAAYSVQALEATFQSTSETLFTSVFNTSGVVSTANVVDQEVASATSDNAIRPVGFAVDQTWSPRLYFGVDGYTPTDSTMTNFNFTGSTLKDQLVTSTGVPSGAPILISPVAAPGQFLPFPGGLVQTSTDVTLIGASGVGTGFGIVASGVQTVTVDWTTGTILTNNNPAFSSTLFGTIDPVVSVSSPVGPGSYVGLYFPVSTTTGGVTTTEITGQALVYTAPVAATPVVSVSLGALTTVKGVTKQVFNVTLNHASDKTVTVQFKTVGLVEKDAAHAGKDYDSVSTLVAFGPGDTSIPVDVTVHTPSVPGLSVFFDGKLSSPSNATIGIGDAFTAVNGANMTFSGSVSVATHGPLAPGQMISGTIDIRESVPSSLVRSGTLDVMVGDKTVAAVKGSFGGKVDTQIAWHGPLPPSTPLLAETVEVNFVPDSESVSRKNYLPTFSGAHGPLVVRIEDIVQDGLPITVGNYQATIVGVGQAVFTKRTDGSYDVAISGTNSKTKMLIAAVKAVGNPTVIHSITDGAPMDTFSAPAVSPTGDLSFNGLNGLTVNNVKDNHLVTLKGLNNAVIVFGNVASTVMKATGTIKSLTVKSWTGGSVAAGTVGTISSAGSFDADVRATAVGTLTVGGVLGGTSSTDVRNVVAGSFGVVTVRAFEFANLFAGVRPGVVTLPTSRSGFVNKTGAIGSFGFIGKTGVFSNADIAAPVLGTIQLGTVVPDGLATFGITGESVALYKRGKVTATLVKTAKVIDRLSLFVVETV